MDIGLDRRRVLIGASGAAASLIAPSWAAAGPASPVSPERGLESYRRMLCGEEGKEVFWWYIGDIHYHTPGKSVLPVARSLTMGGYTAGKSSARAFNYNFREAGVIVDLKTGEPLRRNPLTGEAVEPQLVDEPMNEVKWAMQDDGSILKTAHGATSKLALRWTETSANMLLLETQPGDDSFALAPADGALDWKGLESTRTVYSKRANLAKRGFVPANMIFSVALKLTPSWLATPTPGDHWLVVRGLGQKGRPGEIINPDTVAMVRQFFPKFL